MKLYYENDVKIMKLLFVLQYHSVLYLLCKGTDKVIRYQSKSWTETLRKFNCE